MSYGFAGYFALGKETTWGTSVSVTDYYKIMSEGLALQIDRFETQNIVGGYYEPDDQAGLRRVEGQVSMFGHPEQMGRVLKGVFGVHSGTTILSGFLNSSKFIPQQSDTSTLAPLPSYTLEINRDVASSQRIDGAVFSSLELGTQNNQDLRMTFGVIAQKMTNIARSVATGTVPTYAGSPVDGFAFDTCSFQIGGVAVSNVEAFSFKHDNQLEGVPTLTATNVISRIRRRSAPVTMISGTMDFSNIDEFTKFLNQTEQQFKAYFTLANSFSLLIDLPRVVYRAFPISMPGRERLTVQFEGKCRYHAGSATAVAITLTTISSAF